MSNEGIDITNMLNDVNTVLHKHLNSLLNPLLAEKQTIHQILLNIPYVKNLEAENVKLKESNIQMQNSIVTLKGNLKSLKEQKARGYQQKDLSIITMTKNINEVVKVVQDKDIIIKELSRKLDQLGKGTVKLEVKELNQPIESTIPLTSTGGQNKKVDEESIALLQNVLPQDDSDSEESSEDNSEDNEIGNNLLDQYNDSNSQFGLEQLSGLSNINWVKEAVSDNESGSEEEEISSEENSTKSSHNAESKKDSDEDNNEDSEEDSDKDKDSEEDSDKDKDSEEDSDKDSDKDKDSEEDSDDNISKKNEKNDKDQNHHEEESDEEEMEVDEIEIEGKMYLTDGTQNGTIYECDENGEILEDENGEWVKIGYFKEGISFFI